MSTVDRSGADRQEKPHGVVVDGQLRRVLGTPSLVLFGLAYLVPLTVFTTYGLITQQTSGHLATAYLVTTVVMAFTAVSYALNVRAHPSAGSAYTYVQRSFGAHAGFITGWALMLDYLLLPMINYLLIGIYVNAQFPWVPAWLVVVLAIALVTATTIVGITVVDKANLVLVGAQLVFAVVFVALVVAQLTGASQRPGLLEPFVSSDLAWPAVFAGAAVLALSFLGFDAISTLSEEARDARRSVPRAIVITTALGGVIFVVLSWASQTALPDWQSITDPDSAGLQVMTEAGGQLLANFFLAAYIAGCFASATASQVSVARILFAMGRDGVLPRGVFGALSARFRTPVGATLVVAAVSLLALVIDLATLASVISFGALAAFSLVNLTVVKGYVIDGRRRSPRDIALYGVVPVIGFVLTLWLWTNLTAETFVVGGAWALVGVAYLAVLTRGFRRPPPQLAVDHTP
nr:APC family permease [Quadrisphaera setariae]